MLLATVHLAPATTVPPAIGLALMLAWYWVRLGRDDVPASRRKIRRFSIVIMLLSLPMFVRAASFIDPAVDKQQYVVTWTAATFMLLIIIATALMDAVNNLRLHQRQRQDDFTQAATDLALAIRERQQRQADATHDIDGEQA